MFFMWDALHRYLSFLYKSSFVTRRRLTSFYSRYQSSHLIRIWVYTLIFIFNCPRVPLVIGCGKIGLIEETKLWLTYSTRIQITSNVCGWYLIQTKLQASLQKHHDLWKLFSKRWNQRFGGVGGLVRGDVTLFFSKYPENGSFECTKKRAGGQKRQCPRFTADRFWLYYYRSYNHWKCNTPYIFESKPLFLQLTAESMLIKSKSKETYFLKFTAHVLKYWSQKRPEKVEPYCRGILHTKIDFRICLVTLYIALETAKALYR